MTLVPESYTKDDFIKELKTHDWHYMMSDSMKVYDSGNKNEVRLRTIAGHFGWYQLLTDYSNYVYNGAENPLKDA